jgi:hypothetical protein
MWMTPNVEHVYFKGADWKPGVVAAFVFWYAVFDWNVVDYPSYHKGPCYSPNHAFYVTRHQTPWQALTKAFRTTSVPFVSSVRQAIFFTTEILRR